MTPEEHYTLFTFKKVIEDVLYYELQDNISHRDIVLLLSMLELRVQDKEVHKLIRKALELTLGGKPTESTYKKFNKEHPSDVLVFHFFPKS